MRKKYDETYTPVVPFARFKKMDGRFNCLTFNHSAVKRFGMRIGSRVDLFWNAFDDSWDRPTITIRLNGTQRSIINDSRTTGRRVRIHVQRFMRQFSIPYIDGPLPILDAIDDQIIIDASGRLEENARIIKYWKSKLRPQDKARRFEIWFTDQKRIGIRTNDLFFALVEKLAKEEETTRTQFILRCIQFYLEDRYPDVYESLQKELNNESD